MRKLLVILFLYAGGAYSQDKLFFKDGTRRTGIIVTNAKDYVYFRRSDTSEVEKIKKSRLILMEDYKGNRYLFAESDPSKLDSLNHVAKKNTEPRNVLSVQPYAIFFGRANFSYERLSKDQKIGFVIPLILTFDPSFGNAFNGLDSNYQRVKGVDFITGLDINFYLGKKLSVKPFIGPRIRYGTDVAFLNTEGYSIQTQIGIRVGHPAKKVVQHLSIGFGFVRIISSPALPVDPKQAHAWYSLNYRLGVKW